MKTFFLASLATLVLASCSKTLCFTEPAPNPVMKYLDFGDKSIGFGRGFAMDLNADGSNDFFISTALIGSPIDQRDYQDFYFNGTLYSYTPVNSEEEMPILTKAAVIGANAFPDYEWYNASQLLLSRRVIPLQGNPFWTGSWKDASHRYVPVSILKNGLYYYGWVELSFDLVQASVILHKAAISLVPGTTVKAGF